MSDEERKAELAILDLSSVGDRIEVARECMVKESIVTFRLVEVSIQNTQFKSSCQASVSNEHSL